MSTFAEQNTSGHVSVAEENTSCHVCVADENTLSDVCVAEKNTPSHVCVAEGNTQSHVHVAEENTLRHVCAAEENTLSHVCVAEGNTFSRVRVAEENTNRELAPDNWSLVREKALTAGRTVSLTLWCLQKYIIYILQQSKQCKPKSADTLFMEQSVHYEHQHQHTPSIHHNTNQCTVLCVPSWINNTVATSVFSFGSNCMFIVVIVCWWYDFTADDDSDHGPGTASYDFSTSSDGFTFRSHK